MIDLHSHILPGVDDGARTMDDSLALARDAVIDGISAMVATPHVRHDYPTDPAVMAGLVERLRLALAEGGIPLDVLPGGEIALEPLMGMDAAMLDRFSLGGSGRYVLVEFPYDGWPLPLPEQVDRLVTMGVTPIIAHPERSADVQERPGRLAPLVEAGAMAQITAASLDGRLGRPSYRAAVSLLDQELAHVIASDAHMPGVRAVGMAAAAASLGDGPLAEWLTREVPAAVVAGEAIPRRPVAHRRRRGWFRRG